VKRTLTALLPLLALTACALPAPSSTTTSAPDAPSTPPSSAPAAPSVAGIPPKPDAATQAAYIADLEAIDPDIVHGKPDKAVSRGRDQCGTVANAPTDQAKLIDFTTQRFTSPDHPNGFGPEVSARILAAVRKHICPTY
jgi:hypothetical protein